MQYNSIKRPFWSKNPFFIFFEFGSWLTIPAWNDKNRLKWLKNIYFIYIISFQALFIDQTRVIRRKSQKKGEIGPFSMKNRKRIKNFKIWPWNINQGTLKPICANFERNRWVTSKFQFWPVTPRICHPWFSTVFRLYLENYCSDWKSEEILLIGNFESYKIDRGSHHEIRPLKWSN